MLKINNLKANIDNKAILNGFNLEIRPGEVHAIMGPNGSGKSTLVKILQGIYPPKTGKIKFGKNVNIKYFDQNKENINLNKSISLHYI